MHSRDPATICMGRHIYDNLRKATSYVLSVHIPIVGMAMRPGLLDLFRS